MTDNIKNYAKNLDEPEIKSTDTNTLGIEFNEALGEQFGASFHAIRTFVDAIENVGIKRHRAIFTLKRSEVLDAVEQEHLIELDAAATLIDVLTFKGRSRWRSVPDGYEERDRFPWRFRRRLSVLRMPLIELDAEQDPMIIVAPGIVRDAVVYMIGNYHRGDYPLRQLKPKMKCWAGKSRKRMGRDFSTAVAERLKELGWEAEPEVRVTKLLQKGFEYLGSNNAPKIEGDLVFKNPVPMKFAWKRIESRVPLHLFSELDSL